jgi:predicted Fe-Mo cluster-binding NifX family protein
MMSPAAGILAMQINQKESPMKIAIITDDGKSISQHFGRAAYYMVLTIEDGKITERELRDKVGHSQFSAVGPEEHHHEQHGLDDASHNKHAMMAGSITDCQAVICGGMGMGAYESMRRLNIKPIVTNEASVEAAAQAYIDGKLVDHTEKLH